ncbi:SH2 motif and Tyrosine protein kinase domain containing protein [Aphelenchoides fujianensis]|nr:SH2 motif and Tyrosine protein kinase domain containing protein [Aphelenchoides fujianensis]
MSRVPPDPRILRQKRLEDQVWYHGIRSREEIEPELRHLGDFAVRSTTQRGMVEIVLNVRSDTGVSNFTLSIAPETPDVPWPRYFLHYLQNNPQRPEFDTVVDLVNHYRFNRLPGEQILKKGVHRPRWLLKHRSIQFNRQKDRLGAGNFCEVFKGHITDERGSAVSVAIKVCHSSQTADLAAGEEARRSLMREAKIMNAYQHPHVINFVGVACDHFPVMIVMGFCPGGSLEDHVRKRSARISSHELLLYAFEASAAYGMRYLHRQGCIHRDLAARNCLISADGAVRIADFGLSKLVGDFNPENEVLQAIPLRWMAPETLSRTPLNSDVWAWAIMCFEFFNGGRAPWDGVDDNKAISRAIRAIDIPPLPEQTPEVIKQIAAEIWVRDPERRPTFKQIVVRLLDHLLAHVSEFPSVEQLAVNQLPDEPRDQIVKEDRSAAVSQSSRRLRPPSRRRQAPGVASRSSSLSSETTRRPSIRNNERRTQSTDEEREN